MEVAPLSKPYHLEPDGFITTDSNQHSEYAPALSSSRALARFEFEADRGNDGTKILMVEWSDEDGDSDWEISWEGKTTVLPAKEVSHDNLLRIYFLLAPGASIPRIVGISRIGAKSLYLQTNPLPAIFPPELGAVSHGRKGMLHTLWAKARLSIIQKEIELEMKNGEGVGLEMALQEKQWIIDNFGVASKHVPELQYTMKPTKLSSLGSQKTCQNLKSGLAPGGKSSQANVPISATNGLLQTLTERKMLKSRTEHNFTTDQFSEYPLPIDSENATTASRLTPKFPSRSFSNQQPFKTEVSGNIAGSIDSNTRNRIHTEDEFEPEDELFALKLSPRSPEMIRSPFSLVGNS
ncbi:hypothetical protein BGHDH14_bgh03997 [Blumeria hordei DH14]|uniref:Uncharacterized protein n=1 Tax=Blumeria graminis f. sp. hordei (strain DH14) TaxID=546991 RepID=N1J5C5_BLUG1|nr:hypothetical protein BGHDH14_bgh03997 [Blumeria hordei DH14]